MTPNETKQKYYETIGEFIVSYAQLDLFSSMFFAAKDHASPNNFYLRVYVATSFYKQGRYKKLNDIIVSTPKPYQTPVIKRWKNLYPQILELEEIRNHLVHGTAMSLFAFEPISTCIVDKKDNKTSTGKFFTINQIKEHNIRLLKVINEVKAELWHEYCKCLGIEGYPLTGLHF